MWTENRTRIVTLMGFTLHFIQAECRQEGFYRVKTVAVIQFP